MEITPFERGLYFNNWSDVIMAFFFTLQLSESCMDALMSKSCYITWSIGEFLLRIYSQIAYFQAPKSNIFNNKSPAWACPKSTSSDICNKSSVSRWTAVWNCYTFFWMLSCFHLILLAQWNDVASSVISLHANATNLHVISPAEVKRRHLMETALPRDLATQIFDNVFWKRCVVTPGIRFTKVIITGQAVLRSDSLAAAVTHHVFISVKRKAKWNNGLLNKGVQTHVFFLFIFILFICNGL